MKINDFSIKDIKDIPYVDNPSGDKYDSVLIIPSENLHESGWKCMHFIFCRKDEIICKAGGGSDALHLDGIGGYGDWKSYEGVPSALSNKGWVIDCTPSGYIRLHAKYPLTIGAGCSDFEIYANNPKK